MDALSKDLSAPLSMEPATLDGLETFFEVSSQVSDPVTSHGMTQAEAVVELWTLSEAASQLGVSTRTVLRHLKNGRLQGRKVDGPNGLEWRIMAIDTQDMTVRVTDDVVRSCPEPVMSTGDMTDDTTLQALLKVIESQAEQLKAASTVITYQQTQLEEKDNHIKLLADSQHKAGWWARFKSWASGS